MSDQREIHGTFASRWERGHWRIGVYRLSFSAMRFEKVHTVRDFYDGVRTGTADFGGAPHFFSSLHDEQPDDYVDHFRLYPVTAEFMERELRHWAIYRGWEAKFHRGLVSPETHPGHGGVNAEYDELGRWLDEQIKLLDAIPSLYTATFRTLPGQEDLPVGILREMEVVWTLASAQGQQWTRRVPP